jgi:protease-4
MAYANSYTQKEYYLNSVASPIYINPVGDMDFKGLSAELMFLKIYRKNGVKWK